MNAPQQKDAHETLVEQAEAIQQATDNIGDDDNALLIVVANGKTYPLNLWSADVLQIIVDAMISVVSFAQSQMVDE